VWNSFVSDVLPPAIIHFMGATKPWHATFAENHPIRAEMETYLARTPWRGFVQRVPFSQAWDALQWDQGAPTRAARPERSRLPHTTDFAAIARHLGTALFADVEQGITKIRLDRLPARHIGSVQAT